MQIMGLVVFFYSPQSFYSSIILISSDDCVTPHITHFNFIYFKHCKPACTALRSNIKFCVWWNLSWLFECFKRCSEMILLLFGRNSNCAILQLLAKISQGTLSFQNFSFLEIAYRGSLYHVGGRTKWEELGFVILKMLRR